MVLLRTCTIEKGAFCGGLAMCALGDGGFDQQVKRYDEENVMST